MKTCTLLHPSFSNSRILKFSNYILLLGSCFLGLFTQAQSGTWVWMNGSKTTDPAGVFGTQGTPSVNNSPPGLYQASYWLDKNGNFWIFAGLDENFLEHDDLWEYNPGANTWTWVKGTGSEFQAGIYGTQGVPDINNMPGARGWGTECWTDSSGDLWLFGGIGYDMGGNRDALNDLWKYNIASNEWTWMSGSSSGNSEGDYGVLHQTSANAVPPSRGESNVAWIDGNNNLWLFGGQDYEDGGGFDDIWRYNIGSNEWAWMGGTQETYATAVYGTLGVESPDNLPDSRFCYAHWINGTDLYFTGGQSASGFSGYLNDVWRFNMNTNNWTWVGGDTLAGESGDYADYCSLNNGNMPRGMKEQRTAEVNGCTPVLYMFGGWGLLNGAIEPVNDLWNFDLASNKWRWVCGSGVLDAPGNFGAEGVISPSNLPPGLAGTSFWSDSLGDLWVWGGMNVSNVTYNALWKYVPDNSCIPVDTGNSEFSYTLSASVICRGDSAIIGFSSGDSAIILSPVNSVNWIDALHATLKPDTSTQFTISGYSACGIYDTLSLTLAVKTDTLNITSNKNAICQGDSALLTFAADSGLSISPLTGVSWTDSLHAVFSPDTSTLYTITGYSACGSYNTRQFNLQVYTDTVNISSNKQVMCNGDTAQICAPAGFSGYTWNTGDTTTCISTTSAGNYYVSVTENNNCLATSQHINISVYPPIIVSTSVSGDTLKGFDAHAYQWILNDTLIPGATNSIYIAKTGGSYTLQITDSNGCIENSTPIVINGINNIPSQNSITVFPNPTNTGWQLNVTGEWMGSMVEIFDATGRSVFKSTITNQHSMIEIAGLASGVYELRLTQQGYNVVRKLVKM